MDGSKEWNGRYGIVDRVIREEIDGVIYDIPYIFCNDKPTELYRVAPDMESFVQIMF